MHRTSKKYCLIPLSLLGFYFLFYAVLTAKTPEPVKDYYAEEKAKQSFELASQLYHHHLYQEALTEAAKIPALYPQTAKAPEILLLIGTVHADKSNPTYNPHLAIETWRQLVDQYPNHPQAPLTLMFIAEQYELMDDWQNAMHTYDQLTTRYLQDKLVDDALFWSACAEYKLKRYAEARTKWQTIITRYPDSQDDFTKTKGAFIDDALIMIADVSLLLQDTTATTTAWERIVEQYPDSPYWTLALYHLGKIYQESFFQPVQAISYYQKIVEYNSDPTWQRLAKLKIEQCRKISP